jgi:hypothetical protein
VQLRNAEMHGKRKLRERKDNEKKREGLTTDKREMEKGRRANLE